MRESWSSYRGFIIASIASAVGLGNIWRFPYIVGSNGGGAFLLPYIIVIFSFGLALMTLELVVGRYYKTSVIECFARIRDRFKFLGMIVITITFIILSYYLVILGWMLSYFISMLLNINMNFDAYTGSYYPILSFFIVLAINYLIIRSGVMYGIERISKIGVYILLAIIIPLTIIGLFLPNSEKGVQFYLTPDIEKLGDPHTWGVAFGQAFFSLSIGTGILLTYSSYLHSKQSPILSSLIIISADFLIAFTAGLMIFIIVFAFGLEADQGASLAFVAMPTIFTNMEFGNIIGMLFFMLLFIAGLTSSISMFQVPVAALEDSLGFDRRKATIIISILLLIAGLPSALSYSNLHLEIVDIPILDMMDHIFGTFGIAVSAAIFTIIVTWFAPKDKIMELVNTRIPDFIFTIVKIVAPILIIATIIAQILT
jgi:NSS family neurotransmitter:Na+ symporter